MIVANANFGNSQNLPRNTSGEKITSIKQNETCSPKNRRPAHLSPGHYGPWQTQLYSGSTGDTDGLAQGLNHPIVKVLSTPKNPSPILEQINFISSEDEMTAGKNMKQRIKAVSVKGDSNIQKEATVDQLMKIIEEKNAMISKMEEEKRSLQKKLLSHKKIDGMATKGQIDSAAQQDKENEKVKNLIGQLRILTQFSKHKGNRISRDQQCKTPRANTALSSKTIYIIY